MSHKAQRFLQRSLQYEGRYSRLRGGHGNAGCRRGGGYSAGSASCRCGVGDSAVVGPSSRDELSGVDLSVVFSSASVSLFPSVVSADRQSATTAPDLSVLAAHIDDFCKKKRKKTEAGTGQHYVFRRISQTSNIGPEVRGSPAPRDASSEGRDVHSELSVRDEFSEQPPDVIVHPKNISVLIPAVRKIEFESCKQLKTR